MSCRFRRPSLGWQASHGLDRRGRLVSFSIMKAALVALALMTASAFAAPLQDIPFKTMDGKEASLKDYSGKVILVVNVASKCGLTKQYDALEALYKKYSAHGFVILGFPCNDFNGQEPGTVEEIQTFCRKNFGVTFPLFDKILSLIHI